MNRRDFCKKAAVAVPVAGAIGMATVTPKPASEESLPVLSLPEQNDLSLDPRYNMMFSFGLPHRYDTSDAWKRERIARNLLDSFDQNTRTRIGRSLLNS